MWDELRKDWQRMAEPHQAPSPELVERVRQASDRMERRLWWRDAREIAAAAIVAVWFGYVALTYDPLLARIGSALLVLHAFAVSGILLFSRRAGGRARPGEPPATELRRRLAAVDTQIRLLRRVAWWYILPGDVGVMLIFISLVTDPWVLAALTGGLVLLSVGIWWLNQYAVRVDLLPWRNHLADLIRQLENRGDDAAD